MLHCHQAFSGAYGKDYIPCPLTLITITHHAIPWSMGKNTGTGCHTWL